MKYNKWLIVVLSTLTILPCQAIQSFSTDAMLQYYKLEVERLNVLIQLDAETLRSHYREKIETIHVEYEKKMNALEATIAMQRAIIEHMSKLKK